MLVKDALHTFPAEVMHSAGNVYKDTRLPKKYFYISICH